eukprot:s4893_g2.t1
MFLALQQNGLTDSCLKATLIEAAMNLATKVFWCGSSVNAAAAAQILSCHLTSDLTEFRAVARIRYRGHFDQVAMTSDVEVIPNSHNCLLGSPKDMGFAEITQLADKIQAVVVAVGLWSSEKPIRPSGWSMASSMLMWEGLGGPNSNFNMLVLMHKGEGRNERLQGILADSIAASKPWRGFKLDPKSAKSALTPVVFPPPSTPEPSVPKEQSADPKPETENTAAKKASYADTLKSCCEQLKSLSESKRPWFLPVVSAKRQKISTSPPEIRSRQTILTRLASSSTVYQMGANESLDILGWDSDAVNVHLVGATARSGILAATLPKAVADILVASALRLTDTAGSA